MEITDRFYGIFEVREPVFLDLIKSKTVQRLKGISQYGVPDEFYFVSGFSRYEHSIGVMLLLKKHRCSLEEQMAGLLHDVSHPAFSHVFDWAFGDPEKEDFQDNNHESFIFKTEIPEIISDYGFKPREIINFKNYKILEREIPDLCADRFDYSIRDFIMNENIARFCYKNLLVKDNKFVFSKKEAAKAFAINYIKCQNEHWGSADAVLAYHFFSNALKIGIMESIISKKDFYKDEKFVLEKLKNSNNQEIYKILEKLSKPLKYKINDENPQINRKKKFRYVDPEYLKERKLYRLSKEDKKFREYLIKQKKINDMGIKVDMLD